VIDDEGRLAGTVTAEEVLRALAHERANAAKAAASAIAAASPSGVTSPSAAAP